MNDRRARSYGFVAATLFLTLVAETVAQTTNSAEPQPEAVPLEVFTGPKGKKLTPPPYPIGERFDESEGWVNLNFMIDPNGKPYEISVGDSTGNKRFEEIAVATAKDWQFEPATLNGTPIDAGHTIKVTFRLTDAAAGASRDFVFAYRQAVRAIKEGDRAAADAAIAKLKITNLYEDAFFNIARFSYAAAWGDKPQQLAALQRAIAHEQSDSYLPKTTFREALLGLMQLQAEMQDFAGLMGSWLTAKKIGLEPETQKHWEPIIANVTALRTDSRAYAVNGAIDDSATWNYRLYKNRFKIEVTSGRLAEIKLRCATRYVFFKFDPTLQYTINERYGACGMEAIGDPGTKFVLIQS